MGGWWWTRPGSARPVVDMLRSAGLSGRLNAVTIKGAERAHGGGERWQVPRKDLLAGLEVLLETGELKIAKRLAEAGRLARELTSIRFSTGESGEHDDLAMATGLACWRARLGGSGFGTTRLPGFRGWNERGGVFGKTGRRAAAEGGRGTLLQERGEVRLCASSALPTG